MLYPAASSSATLRAAGTQRAAAWRGLAGRGGAVGARWSVVGHGGPWWATEGRGGAKVRVTARSIVDHAGARGGSVGPAPPVHPSNAVVSLQGMRERPQAHPRYQRVT